MYVLTGIISTLLTVVISVISLAYWLGRKFASIDMKFEEIDNKFRKIDERLKELRQEIRSSARTVTSLIHSLHTHLIDFMTMKKLFTPEEREYLLREIERLATAHKTALNPLKPEEVKFILEVVREIREKDPKEIDLSKLDKIMEIAKRWLMEDGCEEAAKLWIVTYTLKAILRRERGDLEERK